MTNCQFPGCDRPLYAKGLCMAHRKQERDGKTLTRLRPRRAGKRQLYTLDELLSWTTRQGDCLVWGRADNKQGYGVAQHGGKQWMAHRLAYHLATGEEIGRQVVHHICANGLCINPIHLQLAHQADNNLEMLARRDYEARIAALEAEVKELRALLDSERQAVA